MVVSINKVILIGNLGSNPIIRMTSSGQKIANLSVATSESWKDKNGEKQEKTEWHRVVVFNKNLADFSERYLMKGAKVYIEGTLQTRKYTDNLGCERFVTEVIIPQFGGSLVTLSGKTQEKQEELSGITNQSNGLDDNSQFCDDEIPF